MRLFSGSAAERSLGRILVGVIIVRWWTRCEPKRQSRSMMPVNVAVHVHVNGCLTAKMVDGA